MFLKYWKRPLVVHPRQCFFRNDAKIKSIFFMGVDFRKKATGILIKFFYWKHLQPTNLSAEKEGTDFSTKFLKKTPLYKHQNYFLVILLLTKLAYIIYMYIINFTRTLYILSPAISFYKKIPTSEIAPKKGGSRHTLCSNLE